MSILLISPQRDPRVWVESLKRFDPDLDLVVYPEEHDPEEIDYAITWNHPPGIFKYYPNLKVIASMGAGVDHIMKDPGIPDNVKITRVVDEQLSEDMSTFIMALVLEHMRNISFHHCSKSWEPRTYLRTGDVKIGIMGLGVLGKAAADLFLKSGFEVSGWSANSKKIKGVHTYSGEKGLEMFLANTSVLVCLLPLTPQTENILNRELFEKLPRNAYLINVARGQHLVEQDLLEMVDNGHLSGASLDVFRTEPLPEEHPFWTHPKVSITPHIASVTHPGSVVPQLMENYYRMKQKKKLKNLVSLKKGY